MRWGSQQVTSEGIGTEPVLPGMRGLLRSVRPPEFAGMVFHEVEARSALNRVPGGAMPFGWTVNPYRGCGHACAYCLAGDTRVLLADGRVRELARLRVGDEICGTRLTGGQRRYVRTTVLAHWETLKPAYRLVLANGTELVCSAEHRFLTGRGWRRVAGGGWRRAPRLAVGDTLRGVGRFAAGPRVDESYQRGYLCGVLRGAGAARGGARQGDLVELLRSRLAGVDLEAARRARRYLERVGVPGERLCLARAGGWSGPGADVEDDPLGPLLGYPAMPEGGWQAGFAAGLFDAAGHRGEGTVRFACSDAEAIERLGEALGGLGFRAVGEPGGPGGPAALRLLGEQADRVRFWHTVDPAVTHKRSLTGEEVAEEHPGLKVAALEPLGLHMPMYDITTGTGDFVADGVVSHNCFARNSHTYLDLDPGDDFNRQIVVKVNVARVLERELRSPRWRREHVAMGTNTDPYQRAEGRYRLMPGVIRALAGAGTPFSVLTKGTLLARDLPLLAAVSADVSVGLGVSIALLDRELQASLEPGTPSPAARLELVRRAAEAGLPCGVMVAPVLPLLTDSVEALDELLARVASAGAAGATVLALHLRPGTREWFLGWLGRQYPGLLAPYGRLYARGAYVDRSYQRELAERVAPLLRRHGLVRATARQGRAAPTAAGAPEGGEQLALL